MASKGGLAEATKSSERFSVPFPQDFPIDVVTYRLANDANQHDLDYVRRFRTLLQGPMHFSSEGLNFIERELDAVTYFKSEAFWELARATQTVSPIVVCQIWLCEQMLKENNAYLPVIGQGEIHLVKETPPDYEAGISFYLPGRWSIVETENLCGLYRYFIGRNQPAVPGFFQYIPEQFESQLRTNRVIHELIANQRVGKLGTRTSKPDILAVDYPELERRPKYHGFEKLQGEHDLVRQKLGAEMPECEGHWYQEVFELYRGLRSRNAGPVTKEEWTFGFAKPGGRIYGRRIDQHDIFFTDWNRPNGLVEAFTKAREFSLSAATDHLNQTVKSFLAQNSGAPLYHDGSPTAAWLLGHMEKPEFIDATSVSRETAAALAQDLLTTDLTGDPELLLLYKICQQHLQNSTSSIVLPRLNPRLHFESLYKQGDSIAWIESEKEARLLDCLGPATAKRIVCPWTTQALAEASLILLVKLREAKWTWTQWLEQQVNIASGAPTQQIEATQVSRLRYEAALNRINGLLQSISHSQLFYMNSTTLLRQQQDAAEVVKMNLGVSPLRNSLPSQALEEIDLFDWLQFVSSVTPDFRLGGNLFYRQSIRGSDLVSRDSRLVLGLRENGVIVTSALLQVIDPDQTNSGQGVLRIRAVTTQAGFQKKGFARRLIAAIVDAADRTLAPRFHAIEAWSAPEIAPAFFAAGFTVNSELRERAEVVHDTKTDRLLETPRLLLPLKRNLTGSSR